MTTDITHTPPTVKAAPAADAGELPSFPLLPAARHEWGWHDEGEEEMDFGMESTTSTTCPTPRHLSRRESFALTPQALRRLSTVPASGFSAHLESYRKVPTPIPEVEKSTTTPAPQEPEVVQPQAVVEATEEAEDVMDRVPGINWDACAEWWNARAWYPSLMGHNIPTFARFIFWHSFLLTMVTPMVRAVSGVWRAEVVSLWVINKVTALVGLPMNLPEQGIEYKIGAKPFTATNGPTSDSTWAMHAAAGLTWLCVSYLQIAVVPKKWHRYTGVFALLVLAVHLGVAINTLLHDHQKHHTLNKVSLSSLTFLVANYAIAGCYKVIKYPGLRSAVKDHKNLMMIGWLWSISGAGPIRMVAAVMEPLGVGPLRCQQAHGSVSTECLWPYFNRLLMIATWNLLMTGCFCRIRQQQALTKTFVKNVACHIVVCVSFGILGFLPGSMPWVDNLMGPATTDRSWITTYILWVAQALQLTIFFPLLFVLLSIMSPGLLAFYVGTLIFAQV